jgi:hypothetical protein
MKKMFLICAIVAALTCFNVMSANAIILEFNPTDIEVPLGTKFSVDLLATDVPVYNAIIGWGLDLIYDNTQMSLDSLTIGSNWSQTTGGIDLDEFGGLLSCDPSNILGDDILLATFDFQCLDVGFSTLDLAVTTGDLTEGFSLLIGGFAEWSYTSANITQTPEPATLFLVGTGLAGLVAARRRKKKL